MATLTAPIPRDVKVIGLICVAHMMSHVYFIALAPVFSMMRDDLGVSNTLLALCISGFGLAAGFGQTPVGFLVDRIGARPILVAGTLVQSGAIALIGFSTEYWHVLALYTLAGTGHTVFHPTNYAIMSATVAGDRLGRAYAMHSFTGNLGFEVTPAIIAGIAAVHDWRLAFLVVGGIGVVFALLLWLSSGRLLGDPGDQPTASDGKPTATAPPPAPGLEDTMKLLFSLPVLMCFLYFVVQMAGAGGLRGFFVVAMDGLHQPPLVTLNAALTGLMIGSSAGVFLGGFVADRFGPTAWLAAVTLLPAGALIALLATMTLPDAVLIGAVTLSGFLSSLLLPSRDLLLTAVAPKGSMGRVMGFSSSGANLALGIVPPVFGWFLDTGQPAYVFWVRAALFAIAFLTFVTLRGRSVGP
ncbi:MAG: MFS transporter [Alphaproteobacteria bacterium]|nr:MFS transporter [Alphaproteobacteria bacterium]